MGHCPTIIPTNSHATVPRIYVDPEIQCYPNVGSATSGEEIFNLITNTGFTHWEDGVVADVVGDHPNFQIVSDAMELFTIPDTLGNYFLSYSNNYITDRGDRPQDFFPMHHPLFLWVKESNWSNTTFLFDYTNEDTAGKMWLATISPWRTAGELKQEQCNGR